MSNPLSQAVNRIFQGIQPPHNFIVAVSGGPDSVALFRAMAESTTGRLVAAHFNHGLRGNESDEDEAFICDLAATVKNISGAGVSCRTEKVRVADQIGRGNLEAEARQLRYDWLLRVAREERIGLVVTGHTLDDQAETVMFNILRGTGLAGLAGIAPRRELGENVELLRPLLSVRRVDVLDYLKSLGQVFRVDRTNDDVSFARNRIRHDLLPFLTNKYNPQLIEVLASLAEQAAAVDGEMVGLAQDLLHASELPRAGDKCIFDASILSNVNRHRMRTMWTLVWRREGWPRGEMGFREWDRLADLALGNESAADFPGDIRARRAGRVVQIGPGS